MEPRKYLRGGGDEGGRFRIQELAATGRTFQVVRCVDTEQGGRTVRAKAPLWDSNGDPDAREDRRRAAEFEIDVLDRGIAGWPEAVALLEIPDDEGGDAPVVVTEWVEGESVYDYVAKRPREVLDFGELLEVVRDAGSRVRDLHEAGYLFRDLDPRHILVDNSGAFAGFTGTGNITPLGESPIRPSSDYAEAPYVAPEARQERSGETMRPAADVYGLTALLAYLLTGEEPTAAVESPLPGRGYELLEHIEPDGLRHLVAAGLQPVAKNRVALEVFLERATLDDLPESGEPLLDSGDGIKTLPPPWSGAEPPGQNRAARSNLSSGPLISVPREESASDAPEGARSAPREGLPSDVPDGAPSSELEGVKSDPVREFLGEQDEIGAESEGDEEDEEDTIRRREDGAPAREVSMVRENVGGGAEAEPEPSSGDPLPELSELPLRTRLLLGLGLPLAVVAAVVISGLLGLY